MLAWLFSEIFRICNITCRATWLCYDIKESLNRFLTGSLKQAIWKNPSLHYEQEMDMPQEEWLLTTPSGVVYKDQIALLHIFERDYFILLKQNVKLDIHVFHLKLCHDGQQLKSAVMAHYKKCSL